MEKKKILIVEDEAIVAADIAESLESMGYEVIAEVPSGDEALNIINNNRPDLVLMDIVLQGPMTGIVTAGHVRSRFNIPVIYLTAYADKETLDRAKVTEPFGYIMKPFEDKELRPVIEMALYRHEIEEKLRETRRLSMQQLEKKIDDELLRVSRYKEDFLAKMSHKLKTPLNHILGFSELLRTRINGNMPESKDGEYAGNIYKGGQELLKLIDDLLVFTKGEDRGLLNIKEFDISEVIDSMLASIRPAAEAKRHTIELDISEDIKSFFGDILFFKQIITHLFTNAVEFTPDGGTITLKLWLEKDQVKEDVLRISVRDTGIGISPEAMKSIFNPFEPKETPIGDGNRLGIGLALTKKFVGLHGGRIWVESKVDEGSNFEILLPLNL